MRIGQISMRETELAPMRTDTSISPAEAARRTGKHKTTITRAVDNGKITAFRDDDGRLWIEPAELFRVFPEVIDSDAASMRKEGDAPSRNTLTEVDSSLNLRDAQADALRSARIEALERELALEREAAKRERQDKDATIADLRTRLDSMEAMFRQKDTQLTALLTDQRVKETEPPLKPNGLWGWLVGR